MNGLKSTPAQRWLARLSFVLAGLAIVILLVFTGLKSLAMVAVGLAAAVVGVAAAYFFLSRRSIWRWLSLAVLVLAPVAVIIVYAFRDLLWIAVLSAVVWLVAGVTARRALAGSQPDWRMPEYPARPPARYPYLIMDPKSGGGKVEKFGLQRKAEALGADVFLIGGPEPVDVAKLAREAVGAGADLLGVAGGDGTQALVAGIAAEHGISADVPRIPVGVDGESILMPTPVTCTVSPGALRVWVPRDRPRVPAPKPPRDWAGLRYLAGISDTAPSPPH